MPSLLNRGFVEPIIPRFLLQGWAHNVEIELWTAGSWW